MSYKDKYADQIQAQFYKLEDRICADIVRRIKKTGEITSTADWQINKLSELGYSSAEIEDMIRETLKATYPDIFELYDKAIDWEYVRNRKLYEQINAEYIPFEDNLQLQQLLHMTKAQTQASLVNLTQSLGVVQQIGGQFTFLPLTEFYQTTLDAAVFDITSGAFDYNSVLKRTVATLSRSGIRTIDYASGRSSRVAVAARRAVLTGLSQMTGEISRYNAEKLGTDYFEIDRHDGARPTHRPWQGKVWSSEELVTVCGLGTVTGLNGANCYHIYFPFIPGISKRNYTDEELKRLDALEDKKKYFRGQEYDAYEARQKQRQMETAMRAQRAHVRGLERGGADSEDIIVAKARYQGQLAEYKAFCDAMKVDPRMNRVYIDGLGRVALSDKVFRHIEKSVEEQYNKGKLLDNLKVYEKDRKLQKAIRARKYNLTLNIGRQGKHIVGHNNYVEGKSVISISTDELQKIVYEYAGTGEIKRTRKGQWNHREVVDFKKYIGEYINPETGERIKTTIGTMHYSKKGIHVVPANPQGREDI